jgi:hypothetical protein
MIRIEVTSEVLVKSGIAKATGKPYEIREQVAFAHIPNSDGSPSRYPQRILLPVRRDAVPIEAGDYQPTAASFYVGDFGSLAFSPRLTPIRPAVAKAA